MDEVERMIAEARAEARAQVKEELKAAFADELRQDAAKALGEPRTQAISPGSVGGGEAAPPSPAPDTGAPADTAEVVYVYCVIDAEAEPPAVEAGVADAAVERVAAGDLAALVSRVPRAQFGEEPLRRNLNDIEWLEAAARAHQQVLDAAVAGGTIVPLRLCTIYDSRDRVRAMLADQRARFTEALDLLRGKSEWGVKVYADLEALERAARERSGAAGPDAVDEADGGAYFARKQAERSARESARQIARECVEEAHARFEEWAADAVVNRPQNRELAGYEGEMVLNAAYLMEDERAEEFGTLVDELGARYGDKGLRFELTGPWPPYNFVPGRAETLL